MRVVVTGGAGFIGSNLALELDREHDVTVIDNFSNSDFNNLNGFSGEVFAYDLVDFDWPSFFGDEKIDVIFHQAAITDTRIQDQKRMIETNVNAFKKLLDFAVSRDIKVVYASSAAVYGRGKCPMKENQELCPLNAYGFSKYVMDNLALKYIKKFPKINLIGLRYFNVFGPNEKHKGSYASMIYQLYVQMKSGNRPRIFEFGNQTRDHIYVKDVVNANKIFLNTNGQYILNVGTGVKTTFNQLVDYLNQLLNTEYKPEYIKNKYSFYQDNTCADISKIAALGFKPKYSVKEGISDYFKDDNQ